ncbi:YihY/virulence factor BrkB family protein [Epibacterium ulvae]|uniref:YihY/virulence factor BrkB family protein n=1 Tax=Epibacterium ulvae TaxID=1156985 RepID=UPI00248F89BA|nr:YihY/virulence factor BrkB family protein [Epibacterium ulvae]
MLYLASALVEAARRFNAKNSWVLSSHIAMSMMLALFPFVLFTVALASAFTDLFSQTMNKDEVLELIFGAWPQTVADPIVREVKAVLQGSSLSLATFGGIFAVYFASNGVDAIRLAMVSAYHETEARPFWLNRMICVLLVIAGGITLLSAVVFEVVLPFYAQTLSGYLQDLAPIVNWQLGAGWENGLNGILVMTLPLIAVIVCHLVLPAQRPKWIWILPGVVLTYLLCWLASAAFSVYVSRFAEYSTTYAGLAGAMAALVFLYLNAAILIFGAEFNGALMDQNRGERQE